MTPDERRAFLDQLNQIPAKHRAWLESADFELWCYYGWGVVANDAQVSLAHDIFEKWPPGTIHVARWANRTGKTTGVDLINLFAIWRKWRYQNADWEAYLGYLYRVLHAAPLNRLMGYAWSVVDALIAGTADQQLSPITNRPRPGILRPFFHAGKGTDASGSDTLFVKCDNGAQLDFLSTHDGAGRLESLAWWLLTWDEFPRQQPVEDVPLLLDQTFLPRSSDFMAPIILSGTATEDAEAVYSEIEEMAEANPRDWNFTTAKREVNLSQSKESIDRQRRLSMDAEVAGRSLDGLSGQGGFGLFPAFTLKNAFVDTLPEIIRADQIDWTTHKAIASFDHALAHDENVLHIAAVPWPPNAATLIKQRPIRLVKESILRSSRTLTLPEQIRFLRNESAPYSPLVTIVDSTAEGGLSVYRQARKEGLAVIDCSFTARLPGVGIGNKDYALQALQKLLSWGLDTELDELGFVEAWPTPNGPYGALRLPAAWKRTLRQMTVYKRYDEKLRQDRVMSLSMLAWYLIRLYDAGQRARPVGWNIMATRPKRRLVAEGARGATRV